MRNIMVLLTGLILASCSSLSEKDCKKGNWEAIGKNDGTRGYEQYDRHEKACGEYGITPDRSLYDQGFQAGIENYCMSSGKNNGKKNEARVPRQCTDSKLKMTYDNGFKDGFKDFCFAEGENIGKTGLVKAKTYKCGKIKSYKDGVAHGLSSYCTPEMGRSRGKRADTKRVVHCPRATKAAFLNGYQEGIEEYCKRKNGFELGRSGGQSLGSRCPRALMTDFELAYRKGSEYLGLKQKIGTHEVEISKLNAKISDPKTSPDLKEYVSKELAAKQRVKKSLEVKLIKIEGFIGI